MSLLAFDDFFHPLSSRPHYYYRQRQPQYNYPVLALLNNSLSEMQELERQLGQILQEPQAQSNSGDYVFRCNVAGYRPEELSVDMVQGQAGTPSQLVVRGEHKQEGDGERLLRTFERHISVPEWINAETIKCNMDESGRLLEVKAERKDRQVEEGQKKSIPIGFKASSGNSNGTALEQNAPAKESQKVPEPSK